MAKKDDGKKKVTSVMLAFAGYIEDYVRRLSEYKPEFLERGSEFELLGPIYYCSICKDIVEMMSWGQLTPTMWSGGSADYIANWLEFRHTPQQAARFRNSIKSILKCARANSCEIARQGEFYGWNLAEWGNRIEPWIEEIQTKLICFSANLRFMAEGVGGETVATVQQFPESDDFLINVLDSKTIDAPAVQMKKKMPRGEANIKTAEFLKEFNVKNPNRRATTREISESVGCSHGALSKLSAYLAYKDEWDRRMNGSNAKGDTLNDLIEQQKTDDKSNKVSSKKLPAAFVHERSRVFMDTKSEDLD